MDTEDYQIQDHQKWLGYLQPDGLVVSPQVLVDSQVFINRHSAPIQQRFREFVDEKERISDLLSFLSGFLEWPETRIFGTDKGGVVPDELKIPLREYGEILEPDFVLNEKSGKPIILVKQADGDLDKRGGSDWGVSQAQRFERLLRDSQVPIGILAAPDSLRLVYAPRGENSGSVTFMVSAMLETAGRPIVAALHELLNKERLFSVPTEVRLPALLSKSREYQSRVSEQLAHQVLEALFELVRGFQSADEKSKGVLLKDVLAKNPNHIYEGLLNVLMRLVFILFAEDRALLPTSALYTLNYSVHGLFERLRADNQTYPDTMDSRYGGWSQLLALFRAIYSGCSHPDLSMPARHGYLFDPERFPFLEGKTTPEAIVPLLSDGTLFRALEKLLILKGERLSYRTLDVEQVGGVYETMMGFRLERANGISVSLKAAKAHGAPTAVNLEGLLALKPADRVKWLAENAETKLTAAAAEAVKDAKVLDDMLVALEKRIARGVTPHPVPRGAMILQPSEERRRSGSHYTPRSFTEPIVRKTLEPIFARLGEKPTPEMILALKICDIAVGSGAFLVETCRQLAEKLVEAWKLHACMPEVPADEDIILYARRIVAQRCLYGVDRNPMATDLCKLSLWLATLAKNHPFTFLDHAIRCGDSLVGLTRRQIETFSWKADSKQGQLWEQEVRKRTASALRERQGLLSMGDVTPQLKRDKLAKADELLDLVRFIGDAAVVAFFAADKDKAREDKRAELAERIADYLDSGNLKQSLADEVNFLRTGQFPVTPFHWEIEFPEVFDRENPGFDGIVGNPPFIRGNSISGSLGEAYLSWLHSTFPGAGGQSDIVALFFRRAFQSLRAGGAFGLIATMTIARGDTRAAGLEAIIDKGGNVFAALKRLPWPGQAAVTVSVVWVLKQLMPSNFNLDGIPCETITSFLLPAGPNKMPSLLRANSELAFEGYKYTGEGFLFSDDGGGSETFATMRQLMESDPKNGERIRPLLRGEAFLENPTQEHDRFVIDFEDFDEQIARRWPKLFSILEQKVKPFRAQQKNDSLRNIWWQFGRIRPALRAASAGKTQLLMRPKISTHHVFGFVPGNIFISAPHVAIVRDEFSALSILQSSAHEIWVITFGAALEDRICYTPSDCLETFPFPDGFKTNSAMEEIGQEYCRFRSELMIKNNEGLTKTYNRFHNPEESSLGVLQLRKLHAKMDETVLRAYGWDDLIPRCTYQFLLNYEDEEEAENGKPSKRKKPYRYRWPDEVRDEVLARLLKLNAERAEEEHIQGIANGGKKTSSKSKKAATNPDQTLLL